MVVALFGLPGAGKTRLALGLAARRADTFVLHTDLLKVTLRAVAGFPRGPAWAGGAEGLEARLDAVRPVLVAHAEKARADGYDLVIEGTLALVADADRRVRLEAPEPIRAARITTKPASARRAAARADLNALCDRLARTPADLTLDAGAPLATLIADLEARLWPRD